MWSMVAQRLTQITPPAATPDQLWQRVEAAWSAVPQEHIQSLFESMPRRVAAFTCRNCGGGDRGRVAIYRPFGEVSLSLNRTVTCMVLKANDRRTSCPCHDEFRGPRSDYVRQVALATTTTTKRFDFLLGISKGFRLFASLIRNSFLGFGWKRVAINSGPKNPKDLLKKRRVRCHNLRGHPSNHSSKFHRNRMNGLGKHKRHTDG
ncbi:uncharacterized protein TNCV_3202031 [Trichonephila clavipes]|nr:uncharacterized protein TNCV_3202031 [Trichonephila clavipes]